MIGVDEKVMFEGAKNALKVVLAMNEGESLLIVTDEHKSDIASVSGGVKGKFGRRNP